MFKFTKDDLLFLVPPLIGALLGLRYATAQTVLDRVIGYVASIVMGIYVGGGVAEYLHLGDLGRGGAMFTVAAVGMEVVAYIVAVFREGQTNPVAIARKWLNAVWGRPE